MGTVQLIPENIRIEGTNTLKPSAVVGGDESWNDPGLSNYTENWLSIRPAGGQGPWATCDFPPIDFPSGAVVYLVDFSVIMQLDNELGASGGFVSLHLRDTASGDNLAFVSNDPAEVLVIPADGTPHTVDFLGGTIPGPGWIDTNTGDPASAALITAAFAAGASISVYRISADEDGNNADYGLITYYLRGVLAYIGAEPAPPWRLFPRDDNLGNSPRLFPPPTTRQRSNRISGTW